MVNILTSSQIPCEIREEVSGRVKPLSEVIGKGAVLADPVNRGAEYAVLQDEQPAQKQRKEKQTSRRKILSGKTFQRSRSAVLSAGLSFSVIFPALLFPLRFLFHARISPLSDAWRLSAYSGKYTFFFSAVWVSFLLFAALSCFFTGCTLCILTVSSLVSFKR